VFNACFIAICMLYLRCAQATSNFPVKSFGLPVEGEVFPVFPFLSVSFH